MANFIIKKRLIEYFLLFYLLATSGFITFSYNIIYIIIGVIISGIIFISRHLKFDKELFLIFFVFFVVQISQSLIFHFFPIKTYLGLYGRLLFAYFTVKIIGNFFLERYIKILKFLIIVSLVFFFISFLFPDFSLFFTSNITPLFSDPFRTFEKINDKTIIIYNFFGTQNEYSLIRNSGPFWEPGAFAGYLIIGLYFNYVLNRKLFNRFGKYSIIALITTFSTAGYLAFFSFILMIFLFTTRRYKYKIFVNIFLGLILISFFIITFLNVQFLGNKINSKISEIKIENYGGEVYVASTNRFASAIKDIYDVINYPLTGLGRNFKTRFKGYRIEDYQFTHRNNGITNLLATYGFIIFILYFSLVKRGFDNFTRQKYLSLIGIILLFIIGFSEEYFTKVFFISLMFLSFVKNKTE